MVENGDDLGVVLLEIGSVLDVWLQLTRLFYVNILVFWNWLSFEARFVKIRKIVGQLSIFKSDGFSCIKICQDRLIHGFIPASLSRPLNALSPLVGRQVSSLPILLTATDYPNIISCAISDITYLRLYPELLAFSIPLWKCPPSLLVIARTLCNIGHGIRKSQKTEQNNLRAVNDSSFRLSILAYILHLLFNPQPPSFNLYLQVY